MAALSPLMSVMTKAAEKASRSLLRDFGEVENLQVSQKGPGDFVSAADKRAEEIIHRELTKSYPDHSFLMEESGAIKGSETDHIWIIDPLDGTTNFLHGLPHWCISIAYQLKGELTAGLVFDPVKDEMFIAEKGQGAFNSRRQRLRVSGRRQLDMSLTLVGEPQRALKDSGSKFAAEYKAVQDTGIAMRRYGAAALDLAYVAAGRCDAFWERNLKPWDVAAGILLVKEAGGYVGDIDSTTAKPLETGNVLAANNFLFDDLRKILQAVK
ncbi:MAG: inositol monophosphatase [Alphaproteobacteria bacterium]|nr:inositol monophosphatase [Alphaproteobacteria bacterium]MCD8519973.1 inositol monophosphatase [Alphaproteobacteria bacterium]MCD8526018.1 inositol monophosphatase [Alphaproteobacteria bacterium]MCD8571107.1 inositol monophosphatase [Alphaproteobacteria bacterium]